MNYSTVLESVAHNQDGVVFDLGSIYERLSALTDHRHRYGAATTSGRSKTISPACGRTLSSC